MGGWEGDGARVGFAKKGKRGWITPKLPFFQERPRRRGARHFCN